jgi:exosortase/archaeosortase family protein
LAVVLLAIAYHYSLETLFQSVTTQTPLAYLGLVPLFSLILAAALIAPRPNEPAIHDRQVDYIIGLPLLIAAVAFNILMPVRLSTMFWLWRLDLVSMPVFAAGVIALLFGTRTLWRLRIPVLFLILAWPLPYTTFLVNWLNGFTGTTLAALNIVLRFIHVASAAPAQGQGVYHVTHRGGGFFVSVASACSGVNGVVGYGLVAVAFLTVVRGTGARKALWLTCGLCLTWASNVVRIVLVLVVGHFAGDKIAIDVLHPMIGLVLFNVVVLAMILSMSRFGLSIRLAASAKIRAAAAEVPRAVPKLGLASAVIAVFVVVAALANSSLRSYDLVESTLGQPRLMAFTDQQSTPAGWEVAHTDTFDWAKPFFGEDSTWLRFTFTPTGSSTPLQARSPIFADVINTSDLSSFSTYGIEACYRFHGFKLYAIQTVYLGNGVTGNALSYYNSQEKSDWTTVYWHWPVHGQNGSTRFERMTLMMINSGAVKVAGSRSTDLTRSVGLGFENALSGVRSTDAKLAQVRGFLVAFAQAVIGQQAAMSAHGRGASVQVAAAR